MVNFFEKESNYNSNDYRSRNFSGIWAKHFINAYVDSLVKLGVHKTQKKFSYYKNEHLPETLYKFYPPTSYSLIDIQDQSLYLSSPRNFNDPFDSYVCIETETFIKHYLLNKLKNLKLISEENQKDKLSEQEYYMILDSWSKAEEKRLIYYTQHKYFYKILYEIKQNKSENFNNLISEIIYQAKKECINKINYIRNLEFRIACFSNFKDEDEMLKNSTMWSHYADNHRGFCVKYAIKIENLQNIDTILCGLFPIQYTSQVSKISPIELLKLKFQNEGLKLNKSILKAAFRALTTKSRFWNYEKEWRLIISRDNFELLSNNTLQFFKIDSIYLGCRIDQNLKKHLVNFAEIKNIKVFEAKQSNEKFILELSSQNVKNLKDEEFFKKLHQINLIKDDVERQEKIRRLYSEDSRILVS